MHDREDLLHDQRRQAERRLIQQQQPRPQQQRARDRQHLLLAARKRAGLLAEALAQSGEIAEHALEVLGDALTVAADVAAKPEVLLDRQLEERAAPVRHVRDAALHDVLGGAAVDTFLAQADFAAGAHHAADRPQRGGLAGTVRTQQRGDTALFHREVDAVQHPRLAIAGVQGTRLKQRRHAALPGFRRDRRGSPRARRAPHPACRRRSSDRTPTPPPCATRASPGSCDARPAGC